MPCLNFTPGLFIDRTWLPGNQTSLDGSITITNTTSGGFPGLTVLRSDGSSEFFAKGTRNLFSITFGNRYVLVLATDTGAGPVTRYVTLVKTTAGAPLTATSILTVTASSNAIDTPNVQISQGSADAFLIWGPNGSGPLGQAVGLGIFRSDTGAILCPGPPPFHPTGEIRGNIIGNNLRIHYTDSTGSHDIDCPFPVGRCNVTPDPQNFPDAVLGPGVNPALATSTRQFTITNNSSPSGNCITVSSIGNVSPYSVVATSRPLPATLDIGQSFTVDVRFAPTAIGTFNQNLPITFSGSTAPGSDTTLRCRGRARAAINTISFAGSINFGNTPVGSTRVQNLTIQNNGEVPVTLNIPGAAAGIIFQWASSSPSLNPGSSTTIAITFQPLSETLYTVGLSFTSTANGSPHTVSLSGRGCIANAEMILPPAPFPVFGQVQRGFRTVRFITIQNTGDGPLNFTARINGPDASLFGLQPEGGSITSPLSISTYTVNPATACGTGATGSGRVIVAVAFFANDIPRLITATLIIDSHNATNGIPASVSYNLSAEIINPVTVDAELVMDRSGSMIEMAGDRTKSETSISAGKLFVELSRPDVDDRLGLIKFNNVPEVVSSIQPVTSGNKPTIVNSINSTNYNPAGATSVAGGVLVALADIDTPRAGSTPASLNRAILVLTDGKDNEPYLNPADTKFYSLLGSGSRSGDDAANTRPLPTSANYPVYAVGIGRQENIDVGQLSILSQATGGEFLAVDTFTGEDYFGLEKLFTQVYMRSVSMATISDPVYTIMPLETHEIEFQVLRGDKSAMVVIYDREGLRLPFNLITPLNEVIDLTIIPVGFQIRPGISPTARFLELLFPQNEPDRYAGVWKVIIRHDGRACYTSPNREDHNFKNSGNRGNEFNGSFQPSHCKPHDKPVVYGIAIGVGSNFSMLPFVQPGIIRVGEAVKLDAIVSEFGLPVLGCNVTVRSLSPDNRISNLVLYDDGSHNDNQSDDGTYTNVYNETYVGGSYQFTFKATGRSRDGEAVTREYVLSKYIQGRLPVDPENPSTGQVPDRGNKECCALLVRYFKVLLVLMALILIILLVLLTRK